MAGRSAVRWHGKQAMAKIVALAERRLDAAALLLEADIKQDMSKPKHGAPITVGAGKGGRAAAAGESPGVRTAHLSSHVTWEKAGRLRRRVGTNVKYGYWEEVGWHTRGGTFVPARPWLIPSLYRNKRKIAALFRGPGR